MNIEKLAKTALPKPQFSSVLFPNVSIMSGVSARTLNFTEVAYVTGNC